MKRCLPTLLAVCLLAANFPQMFCFCGMGAAAARGSGIATACPRCCAKLGRTAMPNNSIPPPCCCQKCKAIQAMPPSAVAAAPTPARSCELAPALADVAGEPWARGHLPFGRGAADSPGESSGLGCALVILFGRLLI
jgi:hypothetical protein